jgi:hypothetical protein
MGKELEIQIILWKVIREQILNIISSVNQDDFFKIPEGLSNNILWIFGHIIRTRDFLILRLAQESSRFPLELDNFFAKGSSPKDWRIENDFLLLNQQKIEKRNLIDKILELEKNHFEYLLIYIKENANKIYSEPYKTSTGYIIDNTLNALRYNMVHESIHLGQLQLYKKLIS